MFLKEHNDVRDKLETALRKKMGIPIPGAANGKAEVAVLPEKPAEKPGSPGCCGCCDRHREPTSAIK